MDRYETTGRKRQPGGSARARAQARRRKRRRQRLLLSGIVLVLTAGLLAGAGIGFGKMRTSSRKQEYIAQGLELMDQGNGEAAIHSFDQAVELAGGRIGKYEKQALFYRAEAEYNQGDFQAALHTYDLLLEEEPEEVLYKKGAVLCLIETGDVARALELGVYPGRVYNQLAVQQMEDGRYQEALDTIAQGLLAEEHQTEPDTQAHRKLSYNQAVCWEYQGDFAKALELFETYAAVYGSSEQVERELTFLRTRQGSHP